MLPRERIKPRPITVKEVQKVIRVYGPECIEAFQQMLAFFGLSPKMERILWATMFKERERLRRHAEETTYGALYDSNDANHRIMRKGRALKKREERIRSGQGVPEQPKKKKPKIVEPEGPKQIIGICPRCGGNVAGTPIPGCSKTKIQAIFYKECKACTYFCETIRKNVRNKTIYYEVEGG